MRLTVDTTAVPDFMNNGKGAGKSAPLSQIRVPPVMDPCLGFTSVSARVGSPSVLSCANARLGVFHAGDHPCNAGCQSTGPVLPKVVNTAMTDHRFHRSHSFNHSRPDAPIPMQLCIYMNQLAVCISPLGFIESGSNIPLAHLWWSLIQVFHLMPGSIDPRQGGVTHRMIIFVKQFIRLASSMRTFERSVEMR